MADQEDVDNDVKLFSSRHVVIEVLPAIALESRTRTMLLSNDGKIFTADAKVLLEESFGPIRAWSHAPSASCCTNDFQIIDRSTDHMWLMAEKYGELVNKFNAQRSADKSASLADTCLEVNASEDRVHSAMGTLEKLGVVEKEQQADRVNPFSYWILTLHGQVAQQHCIVAANNKNIRREPSENQDILKMDIVDAILNLLKAKWTPQVLPKEKKSKKHSSTNRRNEEGSSILF